jgi:hypothetical protein
MKVIKEADYLRVRRVKFENSWAVCFLKPGADQLMELGEDPYRPGYYWLHFEIYDDEETNPLIEGWIKWDGCLNWKTGDDEGHVHFCGPKDAGLFAVIYEEAASLMNNSEYLAEKIKP